MQIQIDAGTIAQLLLSNPDLRHEIVREIAAQTLDQHCTGVQGWVDTCLKDGWEELRNGIASEADKIRASLTERAATYQSGQEASFKRLADKAVSDASAQASSHRTQLEDRLKAVIDETFPLERYVSDQFIRGLTTKVLTDMIQAAFGKTAWQIARDYLRRADGVPSMDPNTQKAALLLEG